MTKQQKQNNLILFVRFLSEFSVIYYLFYNFVLFLTIQIVMVFPTKVLKYNSINTLLQLCAYH